MNVADLVRAVETIAPSSGGEPWDNVGLILGDPARELDDGANVLLTIDLTPEVVEEAVDVSAGAIIAYHPPIFAPIRRFVASSARTRALLRCVESSIAVYSPHTALDAAPGGVADWLLDVAGGDGLRERAALVAATRVDPAATHKLVTFVPVEPSDVLDTIRSALAEAGAGHIGAYTQCSFGSLGTGTFLGGSGTHPSVGQAGRLERVDEVRLETVCPEDRLAEIIEALRHAHPYDEPAFDVYERAPAPDRRTGPGRVATLGSPAALDALADRLRDGLGVSVVHLARAADKPISRIAVCPGSGESLLDAAKSAGAQLFVTGEMKHHQVLAAVDRGVSILLAGHSETERGYLPTLARRLKEIEPRLHPEVSRRDRAPLRALT